MRHAAVAAALLASGCASGGLPARTHDAAPLFRLATVDTPVSDFQALLPRKPAPVPPRPLPDAPGARDGVSIEVRFEDSTGETVMAPRLTAFHGGRARVQVLRQTAYVGDFDVERKDDTCIVDPVVAIAEEGIRLDLTARPGTGGTVLAYALRTARLRRPFDVETFADPGGNRLSLQLPTFDRSVAEGVRGMEHGTWGLLARVPDGEGRSLSVLARVSPEKLEFTSADEDRRDIGLIDASAKEPADPRPDEDPDSLPARAAREALPPAASGRLELRAVTFPTDLPAGCVLEAGAAARALESADAVEPGHLGLVTALVPGTKAACLLDEAYVKDYDVGVGGMGTTAADPVTAVLASGLTAEVDAEGSLGLTWTTTPRWDRFTTSPGGEGRPVSLDVPSPETHRARMAAGEGTRLAVLARLPGGRALGVLVRFVPVE